MVGNEIDCDTLGHVTLVLRHFRSDVSKISHASKMNSTGEDSVGNWEIGVSNKASSCGFEQMGCDIILV
jgi:hypothetical protein